MVQLLKDKAHPHHEKHHLLIGGYHPVDHPDIRAANRYMFRKVTKLVVWVIFFLTCNWFCIHNLGGGSESGLNAHLRNILAEETFKMPGSFEHSTFKDVDSPDSFWGWLENVVAANLAPMPSADTVDVFMSHVGLTAFSSPLRYDGRNMLLDLRLRQIRVDSSAEFDLFSTARQAEVLRDFSYVGADGKEKKVKEAKARGGAVLSGMRSRVPASGSTIPLVLGNDAELAGLLKTLKAEYIDKETRAVVLEATIVNPGTNLGCRGKLGSVLDPATGRFRDGMTKAGLFKAMRELVACLMTEMNGGTLVRIIFLVEFGPSGVVVPQFTFRSTSLDPASLRVYTALIAFFCVLFLLFLSEMTNCCGKWGPRCHLPTWRSKLKILEVMCIGMLVPVAITGRQLQVRVDAVVDPAMVLGLDMDLEDQEDALRKIDGEIGHRGILASEASASYIDMWAFLMLIVWLNALAQACSLVPRMMVAADIVFLKAADLLAACAVVGSVTVAIAFALHLLFAHTTPHFRDLYRSLEATTLFVMGSYDVAADFEGTVEGLWAPLLMASAGSILAYIFLTIFVGILSEGIAPSHEKNQHEQPFHQEVLTLFRRHWNNKDHSKDGKTKKGRSSAFASAAAAATGDGDGAAPSESEPDPWDADSSLRAEPRPTKAGFPPPGNLQLQVQGAGGDGGDARLATRTSARRKGKDEKRQKKSKRSKSKYRVKPGVNKDDWEVFMDDKTKKKYYHNSKTDKTVWRCPWLEKIPNKEKE